MNRGLALEKLQRPEDALGSFQQALVLNPGNAEACFNCANALHKLLRLEDALRLYDQAIALQADYAAAYSNRGTVLLEQNRLEEALSSYDTAIALNRENAETWFNRGCALQQLDEAVTSYDQAIALKPDYADAYFNKALALLLGGQFRQGWELYEWRMQCEKLHAKRSFPQARWTGAENLDGKTILLHGEQGLGDSIQFCRYANLVKQTGARVLLEVPRPLTALLKTLDGVDVVIEQGQPLPAFDYHCPLMSLPLAFRTELHTIPVAGPYLQSSANKRRQWQQRLGHKTRLRVGLVWRGSTVHKGDRARSLPLAEILPCLPPQLDYVSLQKEVREADQQPLHRSGIRHYGEQLADFSDTVALCELLDIVVSVDTSVAHLAAALGKPTWILLPHAPDWRWLLDRSDSPWYPTARLYRQTRPADWGPVLERLSMDLAAL